MGELSDELLKEFPWDYSCFMANRNVYKLQKGIYCYSGCVCVYWCVDLLKGWATNVCPLSAHP